VLLIKEFSTNERKLTSGCPTNYGGKKQSGQMCQSEAEMGDTMENSDDRPFMVSKGLELFVDSGQTLGYSVS